MYIIYVNHASPPPIARIGKFPVFSLAIFPGGGRRAPSVTFLSQIASVNQVWSYFFTLFKLAYIVKASAYLNSPPIL